MWLPCKHRQSFTVLFLKKKHQCLKDQIHFISAKNVHCPNLCQLSPSFQSGLWSIRLFVKLDTQHAHPIQRTGVLVWITTASIYVNKQNQSCFINIPSTWHFRAFFSVPLVSLQIHKTQVLYIEVSVSIFIQKDWACQFPFICKAMCLCSVYKMFFIVLSSVNQIAYNIHAIWSSCHHVCIR